MSYETIAVDGRLIVVDYDSEVEELPSLYSPGHRGGLFINKITLDDGSDALPYVMSIDDETEEEAMAWVERLLDRKLTVRAQDSADLRASNRGDDKW